MWTELMLEYNYWKRKNYKTRNFKQLKQQFWLLKILKSSSEGDRKPSQTSYKGLRV